MASEETVVAEEEGFTSEPCLSSSLGTPNDFIASDEKFGWNATSTEDAAKISKKTFQEPSLLEQYYTYQNLPHR